MAIFCKKVLSYSSIQRVARHSLSHMPRRGISHSRVLSSTSNSKWSYLQGPADFPLVGLTIGKMIEEAVEKNPDREAAVFCQGGIRRTFEQMLEESDRFAAGLVHLGLKKGDRVGIWSPNNLEWVITQYATARIGIILVNINPAYRLHELEFVLKKVGVKALVAAENFKTQNYYEMIQGVCPEMNNAPLNKIKSAKLPELERVIMISDKDHPGSLNFSDVMEAGGNEEKRFVKDVQDSLQFDDPINIQFTSGTTGMPKGATLTHHNILNNSRFIGHILGFQEKPARILVPVPLYHCFGMVGGILVGISNLATCIFPAPSFEPKASLQAVQDEKCNAVYGTPTMYIDMLNHPNFSDFDVTSLSTGIMAGAQCPVEIMKDVMDKMHLKEMTIAYGATETSPVTFQSLRTDPVEKRVTTVGKPHPHIEVKVIDSNGAVTKIGEPGEICTRGYTTMLGYWNDPEKTAEVIKPSGWYHTGDIGVLDEDGYGAIVGRIKDMLIRGGENIYPAEIEELLFTHPKILNVQVIGVPDKRMGEEVCAWIQIKEGQTLTEEEVKEFCRDEISHFKIPRYILFVDEYPMTVTGKVQKFILRERSPKMLGLE